MKGKQVDGIIESLYLTNGYIDTEVTPCQILTPCEN